MFKCWTTSIFTRMVTAPESIIASKGLPLQSNALITNDIFLLMLVLYWLLHGPQTRPSLV